MSLHTINWRGSQSHASGSAGRMAFNCSVNGVKLRAEQVVAMYAEFEAKRKPKNVKSTACGIKEVKAKPQTPKPIISKVAKVIEHVKPIEKPIIKEIANPVISQKKDYRSMTLIELRREIKVSGKKATFRTPKAELIKILEG